MLFDYLNGVVLDQEKEPALSRELVPFLSATTLSCKKLDPPDFPEESSLRDLIKIAESANIIDERNGRPLADRLKRWAGHPIKALVADAIDDEPFVSSQVNPLLKRGGEIAWSLNLLAKALGAKDHYIAVYKNMYDLDSKIPALIENVRVERLGGKYPMESRAAKEFGKEVMLIGCCALMHFYRAVTQGTPQTTAIVTVAGNCVGNPTNLEVTIGMTLSMVLERCGLIKEPTHIVLGGAMKGICVIDPEKTVVKADTRAVLAFKEDKLERRYQCIGCGRCLEACPNGLDPMSLYKSLTSHRQQLALRLDLKDCVGCSTCSYICPSRLDLSHTIFSAKQKLLNKEGANEEIEA